MRNNILIILIIILIPFDFISQKKSEQLKRQNELLLRKLRTQSHY